MAALLMPGHPKLTGQGAAELTEAGVPTLRDFVMPHGGDAALSLHTGRASRFKTHRLSIYRKLGVSSRADAVTAGRNQADLVRGDSPRVNVRR